MKKTIIYSLFLTFTAHVALAQDPFSTQLDELIIEKCRITNQSRSHNIIVLNDYLNEYTKGTFTDLLQKNTTMYFNEIGYGMVSLPAFRGTTAQQTGELWNGI